MTVYVIIGGVCCIWAMLNLLGGERQHRLNRIKFNQRIAASARKAPDPQKPIH